MGNTVPCLMSESLALNPLPTLPHSGQGGRAACAAALVSVRPLPRSFTGTHWSHASHIPYSAQICHCPHHFLLQYSPIRCNNALRLHVWPCTHVSPFLPPPFTCLHAAGLMPARSWMTHSAPWSSESCACVCEIVFHPIACGECSPSVRAKKCVCVRKHPLSHT